MPHVHDGSLPCTTSPNASKSKMFFYSMFPLKGAHDANLIDINFISRVKKSLFTMTG